VLAGRVRGDGAHGVRWRTHQIAKRKSPVDPDWWLGPLSDAHDHLIDAAFKACPPQGLLSNERCMQTKIVESFAAQNSAGAHCPMEKPGLLLCVDLFTATERIYRALGRDPQGAIDWGDPYESLNNLEDQVTARLTEKCPGTEPDKCVAEEMAAILPISANDASRCVLTPDVSRSVRCVTGVERAAALLALSPQATKSCRAKSLLVDQIFCVTDTHGATVVQRAIRSVSAVPAT